MAKQKQTTRPGPGPTMADIKVRAVGAAANTSTGTQDFTVSGFGTPKAALFYVTAATSANTETDHALLSFGATDGTNDRAISGRATDNEGTATDTSRARSNVEVIYMSGTSASTIDFEAEWDSWITDGVRINITNAPTSAYLVTCVLLGGADLSVAVGNLATSGTLNGTASVTGLGFEPDQVIAFGAQNNFTPATNASAYLQLGFADNDGSETQGSWNIAWRDNQNIASLTTNLAASIRYDYLIHRLTAGTTGAPLTSPAYELTSFDAGGFTVTTRLAASGAQFGYVALNYGGGGHWMGTVTSPTSTGTQADTGPGFTPQALLAIATGTDDATSATLSSTDESGCMGFSAVTASEAFAATITGENGTSTSNHSSWTVAKALHHADKLGNVVEADLDSLDASGFTLDFTTVRGVGIKFFVLAIEEAQVGQDFIRRMDETVDIDDDPRRNVTFLRRADEGVDIAEDVRRAAVFLRRTGSTVEIAEDVRRNVSFTRRADEGVDISESVYRLAALIRRVDEGVDVSETTYRALTLVRRTDATVDIAEDVRRLAAFVRRADEGVDISEDLRRFLGILVRVDENLEVSETIHYTEEEAILALFLAMKLGVAQPGLFKGRIQGPLGIEE